MMDVKKELDKIIVPELVNDFLIKKGFEKIAENGYTTDFLEINFLESRAGLNCYIYEIEITGELVGCLPVLEDTEKVVMILEHLLS